ncbi:YCII-related domain-containing protein [Lentibacillus halodurans]|uniref:YCII-related domain-containing protein n=1 Tax=Lentibacillus halodurans TaxID=237679 RepID=A0A1I0W562_9BACI|nr:YciI family protein [Lentibacillus halodurans]SFA83895.1 YCII-related domain-containing protein [Lentibacillus halodurans]
MRYYAVFLPMKDVEKSKEFRSQHLKFLEQMRQEKKVLMNGKFTDGSGGLVIYAADTLDQAVSYLKEDPYIKEGARDWEIHEWAMETNAEFDF